MSEALVTDLQQLVELFKAGGWRELRVESEDISLLLAIDPATSGLASIDLTGNRTPIVGSPGAGAATQSRADTAAAVANHHAPPDPAWHAVVAPNLGTFYRSPKPGSAPFVEVGERVAPETEICLLEVMKLFTSVQAGIAGTIRQIDASDAELVEGGQTLFHIEPE